MSQLGTLDISHNSIQDVMFKAHFSKLFNLTYLELSFNSHLVLSIHLDWVPPFPFKYIYLGSCMLGPHFLKWLETQKNYVELHISDSRISDSIPEWFWINLPTDLSSIELSKNEIRGTICDIKQSGNVSKVNYINLSSNQLEGSIPLFFLFTLK